MIGAPITTVRTPPMLTAYLAERGVAAEVEAVHVEPDALPAYLRSLRDDPAIDGLTVTMPHKKAVIPFLAGISAVARAAGSVNAIKRDGAGQLVGAQFDGIGLVEALAGAGIALDGARVLLAGVGGAGLAIAQAVLVRGCGRLLVADRDVALLALVCETLGGVVDPVAIEAAPEVDLLINATPLGMRAGDPSPFPERLLGRAKAVADIVADPPRTRLADEARALGLPLVTGRDMVAGQIGPIGDWLLDRSVEQ